MDRTIKGHDYYSEPGIREICRTVKYEKDFTARYRAETKIARDLVGRGVVKPGDFLIPAPQHTGRADYTGEIASIIADITGAYVYDVVECEPHEPLIDMKLKGKKPHITMYLRGSIPAEGNLFFVDNVYATGYTFRTANRLFKGRLIPLVYAVDRSLTETQIMKGADKDESCHKAAKGQKR